MKIKTRKGIEFEIDESDFDLVNKKVWRIDHGYVRSQSGYLHRYLLENPKGIIDHIDGNPLNNKRSNLRVCTQQQNIMNKRKTKNSSSKYKGVSWLKRDKKWYACINKNYKTISIGLFNDEESAARAYDIKAKELFGEYAYTNGII